MDIQKELKGDIGEEAVMQVSFSYINWLWPLRDFLIALACEKAFAIGYDGYVCLKPKTELKDHYFTKYGFQFTRLFLITEGKNSLKLIDKYYET